MKRGLWFRSVFLFTAVALSGVVAGLWVLPRLLIKNEINPLPMSDAIMQTAFDPESTRYVADLYRRRLSKNVVCASSQFSPGEYIADYSRSYLVELGVAANDIEVQHLPLTDCFGEALPELVGIVQRSGWKSVLIVVPPETSRRIGGLAPAFFKPLGIQAIVTYSRVSRNDLVDGWWRTHRKAQRVVSAAFGTVLDMCYSECR
jgi:hypothetical protein